MKLEEPISYIYSSNSDITALELRRKRKEKQIFIKVTGKQIERNVEN